MLFQQGASHHMVHYRSVELTTPVSDQLVAHCLYRQSRSVRSIGQHRVHRITDVDDLRAQRDIAAQIFAQAVQGIDHVGRTASTQFPIIYHKAGLIGYRSLRKAGDARRLGFYGFGAAAHILVQIATWQGREVFAFTRPGDTAAQDFARETGAVWAGGSDTAAPVPLDAAILFAPVGALIPAALRAVRKGGRVVCAGIHMSDVPSFPYADLWGERHVLSVANLTRADGEEFFPLARKAGVRTRTVPYPLAQANAALDDLRAGRLQGAAVLVP